MHRFFVEKCAIDGEKIHLTDDIRNHLKSIRLRENEQFILCDGLCLDYVCVLQDGGAKILETKENRAELSVDVAVYLAYTKGDKLDFAVQKSVELGACSIVLFPSSRTIVQLDDAKRTKKQARLQKIAHEAAKQSGRGIMPVVRTVDCFGVAMEDAGKAELPLFLYENEQNITLRGAMKKAESAKTISIVAGPEGGFAPEEVDEAIKAGLIAVSLGARILRAETAPLAALAVTGACL